MGHAVTMKVPRDDASERQGKRWLRRVLGTIAVMIVTLWVIELVNLLVGHRLHAYGILPRRLDGLPGIVFAPLLHAGFPHVAANSVGIALFGTMVAMRSRRELVFVTLAGALVGGIGTWLFGSLVGRYGVHVGASGVVFAYFGYMLAVGIYERRLASILVSVALAVGFGTMLLGVLPTQEGVSWEGHLFGLLGGVGAARFVGTKRRRK